VSTRGVKILVSEAMLLVLKLANLGRTFKLGTGLKVSVGLGDWTCFETLPRLLVTSRRRLFIWLKLLG
jgi:hypothetical protein